MRDFDGKQSRVLSTNKNLQLVVGLLSRPRDMRPLLLGLAPALENTLLAGGPQILQGDQRLKRSEILNYHQNPLLELQ